MTKTEAPRITCRRCHAILGPNNTKGIGPVCARKERQENAAKAAGFKPAAIVKARELIADKAILPLRGRRVFQVIGTKGDRYLTSPASCNCPAGLKGKHACYHRAAAVILAA